MLLGSCCASHCQSARGTGTVQNTPTITTIPCGELGQELCCSSLVGTAGAINCQGWVPRTRSCPWSVSPCLFLWQECSGKQPQGRDWELWTLGAVGTDTGGDPGGNHCSVTQDTPTPPSPSLTVARHDVARHRGPRWDPHCAPPGEKQLSQQPCTSPPAPSSGVIAGASGADVPPGLGGERIEHPLKKIIHNRLTAFASTQTSES